MYQNITTEGGGFVGQIAVPQPVMARLHQADVRNHLVAADRALASAKDGLTMASRAIEKAHRTTTRIDIAAVLSHKEAVQHCLNEVERLAAEALARAGGVSA